MATLIICTILGIIIGCYKAYEDWFDEKFILCVIGVFGGIIGFIVGMGLAIALPMDTYNKTNQASIVNLQDNSSVKGEFFLGCGNINGNMKYVMYYQEHDYIKMIQIDCDNVRIKYTDSTPTLIQTVITPTDSWVNYFAHDMNCGDCTYAIEIPRGTIQNNYTLDAK